MDASLPTGRGGREVKVREPLTILMASRCQGGDNEIVTVHHPGDPQGVENPKIARLHQIIRHLLNNGSPFFTVCLGHQVLCSVLGFELVRRDIPNQGIQRDICLFGKLPTLWLL